MARLRRDMTDEERSLADKYKQLRARDKHEAVLRRGASSRGRQSTSPPVSDEEEEDATVAVELLMSARTRGTGVSTNKTKKPVANVVETSDELLQRLAAVVCSF